MLKRNAGNKNDRNPGNIQQGRQPGSNTGKEAAKTNIKPQTRNDPGAPKTTGPEKKESRADFVRNAPSAKT